MQTDVAVPLKSNTHQEVTPSGNSPKSQPQENSKEVVVERKRDFSAFCDCV